MSRRKISTPEGMAALKAVREVFDAHPRDSLRELPQELEQDFTSLSRQVRAKAVRYTLEELAALAPGRSVEVRVPPFGAVQCIAGVRHTRGTPPSVIEAPALTWCALALGVISWPAALEAGMSVSGERSNISRYFPLC